jgi:hypothetical protein
MLFDYDDVCGTAHAVLAANINPYLVDGSTVVVVKRSSPICKVPSVSYGSMANDDGHLILSRDEHSQLVDGCPQVKQFVRSYIGGDELLNAVERWCLWLPGAPPNLVRDCAEVKQRVSAVRAFRLASNRATTVRLAATRALFGEIRQPTQRYLAIPKVSSENRTYFPVAHVPPRVVANGSLLILPGAGLYEFGVLSSSMLLAWLRAVGGRMKSDLQFSSKLVYNNFPWPDNPTKAQRQKIEAAAQSVLDMRAKFPNASLADLYDRLTMPAAIVKAHQTLDAAVDAAYRRKGFKNDAERVAFLFVLYHNYTSLLPTAAQARTRRRAR